MILIIMLGIYIDNSTRLSVGVQSNGIGGVSILIDEGLSAFHNPALMSETKFNFTLSRWFNETNLLNFGAAYKNNGLGISYLNYGIIQGYDEFGFPTRTFSPYDLVIAIARRMGNWGLSLKNFQSRIDSVLFAGVAGGLSSFFEFKDIAIGAKVDNLGAELLQRVDVPIIVGTAIKFKIPEDFEFCIEARGLSFELSTGLLYRYENVKIFGGVKYIAPKEYVDRISFADFNLSSGLTILFEEYEFGYSFIYNQFGSAHQVEIIFTP
ncbi:MAG: hypothetical protein ACUVQ4_00215 [bacterium]